MTFYFGLDLGKESDYSAMAIIEAKSTERVELRHCQRFELKTPYTEVVNRVIHFLQQPIVQPDPVLSIDATGVGAPVADLFEARGISPINIKIHAGDTVSVTRGDYRVPKRDLVSNLQVFLQNKIIKTAPALPEADIIVKEMVNFTRKMTENKGHETFNALKDSIHDDMVIAIAIACWTIKNVGAYGQGYQENTEDWPDDEEESDGWEL